MATIANYTYSVSDTAPFEIICDDGQGWRLSQPFDPSTGQAWADAKTATAWIENQIQTVYLAPATPADSTAAPATPASN